LAGEYKKYATKIVIEHTQIRGNTTEKEVENYATNIANKTSA
jgi:hypothetical protein